MTARQSELSRRWGWYLYSRPGRRNLYHHFKNAVEPFWIVIFPLKKIGEIHKSSYKKGWPRTLTEEQIKKLVPLKQFFIRYNPSLNSQPKKHACFFPICISAPHTGAKAKSPYHSCWKEQLDDFQMTHSTKGGPESPKMPVFFTVVVV